MFLIFAVSIAGRMPFPSYSGHRPGGRFGEKVAKAVSGDEKIMPLRFHMPFTHDTVWAFEADGPTEGWLAEFASAMGLLPGQGRASRHVHVELMSRKPGEFFEPVLCRYAKAPTAGDWRIREYPDQALFEHPEIREVLCKVIPDVDEPGRSRQMRRALMPVYLETLRRGGLPLHGALIEIGGSGVILAGRSGEGKSTACRRLPHSWRVLGDDLCLVVRDGYGNYRAHPLPTWSTIRKGFESGRCRSEASVPLVAVFFLAQSPGDECRHLKKSAAAISMAGSALEVFRSIDFGFPNGEDASVKKALYHNAAAAALAIPAYRLRLSLTGLFWERIEEALEEGDWLLDERGTGFQ